MSSMESDVTARQILANQANWNARTPVYVASEFYGVGRKDPFGWFAPFEWAELGELTGRELAHLQCHSGVETIALARSGARAHGLDISQRAVEEARRIAAEQGVRIEYVRADVHDAVAGLGALRFEVVYTGKGALCYLPDLSRWAAVVAQPRPPWPTSGGMASARWSPHWCGPGCGSRA